MDGVFLFRSLSSRDSFRLFLALIYPNLCLKLKIAITTKPIYFFSGELDIGLLVFLGYLIVRFKAWDGFELFF